MSGNLKKILKIVGVLDAITIIVMGGLYFAFDLNLTPILPVLLGVLIVCRVLIKDK